jgi:hypothetical protein
VISKSQRTYSRFCADPRPTRDRPGRWRRRWPARFRHHGVVPVDVHPNSPKICLGLFWSLSASFGLWSLLATPPLTGCLFPQWGIESLRTASTLVGWNECLSVPGGCVRGVFRVSRWVGATLCVDDLLFRVCSFGAWRKGAGRTTLH